LFRDGGDVSGHGIVPIARRHGTLAALSCWRRLMFHLVELRHQISGKHVGSLFG